MNEGKYTIEQILDAIAQADKETVHAIEKKDREMLKAVLEEYLQTAGAEQWTGGKRSE